MSSGLQATWRFARRRSEAVLAPWCRDERGFTAVEFALVAMPFLMLLFGIIAVGLFFFTAFSLENAVEQASRLIRTGQAQETGMTKDQFKAEVCRWAPAFVDCDGKMRVNVVNVPDGTRPVPPACTDAGGLLVPPASTTFTPGAANENVLVKVCYEWELAGKIPFLRLGDQAGGAAMIQAATVFRNEPFSN
jgi:Flp pilus assembly pilin Flp